MNTLKVIIEKIQHINYLDFELDLAQNQITCIVGKNGIGKTTLIKSLKNLIQTDTFDVTSSKNILSKDSKITYIIDGISYEFNYKKIEDNEILDTKDDITELKKEIYSELPFPYGDRFSFFQKISNVDKEIRGAIAVEEYNVPTELITFLTNIYQDDRFENLKEIEYKRQKYYFILKDENYYIREDYFSSGEYFLVNIYKLLQNNTNLIVIDEIDISLDSSAQISLISELRNLLTQYNTNLVFTTHSLAIMKKMKDEELYFMDKVGSSINIENKSYNYIKSLLFQFHDYDKYILTEDDMLEKYMDSFLRNQPLFYKYKIIYIGGASNVVDLMDRNISDNFFTSPENVITVLDKDKYNESNYNQRGDIKFLPFINIEKELYKCYLDGHIDQLITDPTKLSDVAGAKPNNRGKVLLRALKRNGYITDEQVFQIVENHGEASTVDIQTFKTDIISFLNQ